MADKDIFDKFLEDKGHVRKESWITEYNKKKCPNCFSLNIKDAKKCSTCDFIPA